MHVFMRVASVSCMCFCVCRAFFIIWCKALSVQALARASLHFRGFQTCVAKIFDVNRKFYENVKNRTNPPETANIVKNQSYGAKSDLTLEYFSEMIRVQSKVNVFRCSK